VHVPAAFEVTDEGVLYDVIDEYGFATIVSATCGRPAATLAPFFLSRDDPRPRVWGHFARANPQRNALSTESEVLVVFRGPDTYVSPSWYADYPNVPTWNFVVVHAYGIPRVLERDDPRVRWLLERTVERFEAALPDPWSLDGPDDYLSSLSKGVVAFELEITSLEGQFKLSQNQSQANRLGVIRNLEQRPDTDAREIARLMREHEEGT
jgi:transcriptional regulator